MTLEDPYRPPQADLEPPGRDLSGVVVAGALPPFARPLVLAAVHSVVLLWFVYDGWLNDAPEMQRYVTFNRVGSIFPALTVSALIYGASAIRRTVRSCRSGAAADLYLSPDGSVLRVATFPWVWSLTLTGLNLMPHRRPGLGLLWFLASYVTFGLGGIVLAFVARALIARAYQEAGWQRL
ncbi:MAG: hypothetical protein QNK04_02515 [Myxococcota bacterium]|nr:hypothetical protein [Myxococcota bacterium]